MQEHGFAMPGGRVDTQQAPVDIQPQECQPGDRLKVSCAYSTLAAPRLREELGEDFDSCRAIAKLLLFAFYIVLDDGAITAILCDHARFVMYESFGSDHQQDYERKDPAQEHI